MVVSRFVKGKDSVFGRVADSWFRFEEQGRGSSHLHLQLWLEKVPVEETGGSQGGDDEDDSDNDHLQQRYNVF